MESLMRAIFSGLRGLPRGPVGCCWGNMTPPRPAPGAAPGPEGTPAPPRPAPEGVAAPGPEGTPAPPRPFGTAAPGGIVPGGGVPPGSPNEGVAAPGAGRSEARPVVEDGG